MPHDTVVVVALEYTVVLSACCMCSLVRAAASGHGAHCPRARGTRGDAPSLFGGTRADSVGFYVSARDNELMISNKRAGGCGGGEPLILRISVYEGRCPSCSTVQVVHLLE